MGDVGEERAESDDELDAELARQAGHRRGERAPAQVGLDAEQEHDIAVGARQLRVVERVLGPVDPSRHALLERDERPGGLEVEELLGVDVPELAGSELLREVAGRKRRSLRSVVPARERRRREPAVGGSGDARSEGARPRRESTRALRGV